MAGVKICGLRTAETLQAAVAAGAGFVGFVFFAESPRHLSLGQARELRALVPAGVKAVALVVDPDEALLADIVAAVSPDYLQLHGAENPERVAAVKVLFGLPVIKAVAIAGAGDIEIAKKYQGIADILLFDAKPPKSGADMLPGGRGARFDWALLQGAEFTCPVMLAGGLNPENVAEAIKITGAEMVDVSSGVETAPGQKDVGLIRHFIDAAQA